MKTTLTTTIILLFTQFCFAQDFWVELNIPTNAPINSLAIDLDNRIYAGMGNYKGVYMTIDQCETWDQIGLDEIGVLSLLAHPNGRLYAGVNRYNSLYFMESIEQGWIPILSGIGNVISIKITQAGDLFIGNWGEIYKSSDLGETWNQVLELDNTQVINCIVENGDGLMFAGVTAFMGGGGVYRSVNNGDSWEYSGLLNKYISSLAVSSSGLLFAGSRGDHYQYYGGLYGSENDGYTWVELRNDVLVTSIIITPDSHIYIGCTNEHGGQGGVFRSMDNGESWELVVSGMGNYPDVDGLFLAPDGYLYAYGNHLHRSVETVFTPNKIDNTVKNEILIFPNPFTDFLYVDLPINQDLSGYFLVRIFDSAGKLVFIQSINHNQSRTINLTSLSAGLYYTYIEVNGRQYSEPIIKVFR